MKKGGNLKGRIQMASAVIVIFLIATVASVAASDAVMGNATSAGLVPSLMIASISGSTAQKTMAEKLNINRGNQEESSAKKPVVVFSSEKQNEEGLGSEFKELAMAVYGFLVIDDEPAGTMETINGTSQSSSIGLAMTSQYINNQLMNGMRLEFHANPLDGGGAIIFKKTF